MSCLCPWEKHTDKLSLGVDREKREYAIRLVWRISNSQTQVCARESEMKSCCGSSGYDTDTNLLNPGKDSSLHKEIRTQNNSLVEFSIIYAMAHWQVLLGHSVDVHAQNRHQKTPLHLASLKRSFDMSRLLIEHGADKMTKVRVYR